MDATTRTELEAAAFRRLVRHLQEHPEVQNIDLMILADFCRNCMSKWMAAEADERGVAFTLDEAREAIYGMPYAQWKDEHQAPATPEQLAALERRKNPTG